MRSCLVLALALPACGGGGAVPEVPAVPVSVASGLDASATAPIIEPKIKPDNPLSPLPKLPEVAAPTEKPAAWSVAWREGWTAPSFGGWLADTLPGPECRRTADGNSMFGAFMTGRWVGSAGSAQARGGALHIDEVQSKGGAWSIISAATFDRTRRLRLSATIDLHQEPDSWIGLTLMQAQSHYREIALRWDGGRLLVQRYTPCEWQTLGELLPGPADLALEWDPAAGWKYIVDGHTLHVEQLAGAELTADPRVGLFVVHVGAESRPGTVGRQRATVGPITLETSP